MALPKIDAANYETQLDNKRTWLENRFACFNPPALEVHRSPETHYRMRAEFRVWHDGDDMFYAMFEPGKKYAPVRVTECLMADKRIESVMFDLLDTLRVNDELRRKLFQVDFLATRSGELLVSLLYHRPIDEVWVEAVRPLREQFNIDIIGRSRKNKIVLDRDFVIEKLPVAGREYIYKQTENSFTQPNASVCQQMIEWALDASQDTGGDLVEFYCGNGNFTLPLARNFRRVVACEISKDSVRSAHYNLEANGIDNIDVLRMSSEDLSLILKGKKESRRAAGLDLESCEFSTVLVDPPRAGLDDETISQVAEYDNILYISCNPETLFDNLETLSKTHHIERFALFDQFPYTDHMEAGVFLKRR